MTKIYLKLYIYFKIAFLFKRSKKLTILTDYKFFKFFKMQSKLIRKQA